MNKNEMARRKRQMNRRIRELVAIRRASLSLDSMPLDAPAPVSAVPVSAVVAVSAVDVTAAPVRLTPFPQIAPPRQLKAAVTVAAMATWTKSQAAPVCP